jgi:hypothetical protein
VIYLAPGCIAFSLLGGKSLFTCVDRFSPYIDSDTYVLHVRWVVVGGSSVGMRSPHKVKKSGRFFYKLKISDDLFGTDGKFLSVPNNNSIARKSPTQIAPVLMVGRAHKRGLGVCVADEPALPMAFRLFSSWRAP